MIRLLTWLGFLGGALLGLDASTIAVTDGVSAAFAGVRIVAMVIGAYLLLVTLLGLALRTFRLGAAVRVTDLVTLPFVRRLLNRVATVVVAASLVTPAGAHAAERPPEPPPVMRLIDAPPPPAAAPAPVPAPVPAADRYVVRPGDNLWDITERLLAERLGRPPSNAEVVPAWHALIADNADEVPNPALIFSGQVLRVRPA